MAQMLDVCRGTSRDTHTLVCLCREPVHWRSHWIGSTTICPGRGCPACEREMRADDWLSVVGALADGTRRLVIARDTPDLAGHMRAGDVITAPPWRRGKPVKWTRVKTVTIPTSAIVPPEDVVWHLLRIHLVGYEVVGSLEGDWRHTARKQLVHACAERIKAHMIPLD